MMRDIDKKLVLELTSKNIQRSLKEYGIGPHTAAGMLYQLIESAQEQIAKGGTDYQKGINMLKFCYEKLDKSSSKCVHFDTIFTLKNNLYYALLSSASSSPSLCKNLCTEFC